MKKKHFYDTPEIEIINLVTEEVFAVSTETGDIPDFSEEEW